LPVASVSFSGFFLRRFMRSRIQLRMLLCVTQAAKKLQAKSFFRREMQGKLISKERTSEEHRWCRRQNPLIADKDACPESA
jgi:hypothetical protein